MNAIRQANRVVQGVTHFPLEELGKPTKEHRSGNASVTHVSGD